MRIQNDILKAEKQFGEKLLYLDKNENRFGCSPLVTKVIRSSLNGKSLYKYPNPDANPLKEKIANKMGVSKSNIIVGNGSIDIEHMIFDSFLAPDDTVAIINPSYEMFEILASTHGSKIIKIRLGNKFELHVKDLIEKTRLSSCKIVMLCNPNNPTGNIFPKVQIKRILDELKNNIILIDETYAEYAQQTSLHLLRSYHNLLIIRSFSKAYGLAGLRVGYGIADSTIIEILKRVRIPCCVNTVAQLAAKVALDDTEYLKEVVNNTRKEVTRIIKEMENIKEVKPFPSQANFILIQLSLPYSVNDLWKYLLSNGIVVRIFNNPILQNYFRVSVGIPSENSYFIEKIRDYFER